MPKVVIVSVVYKEPSWAETKKCIEACGVPVVYVERSPEGIGSLSRAINYGYEMAKLEYDPEWIWFVTNITFQKSLFDGLINCLYLDVANIMAAIHPCFDSDHIHLRQDLTHHGTTVPFIEFTAPIVRASVFEKIQLDEKMPYVGMDMAWSYDVRQLGYQVGVWHGEKLGHTYNRHLVKNGNRFTRERRRRRQAAVKPTIQRLIERYGKDYKEKIQYWDNL